MSIEVQISKAEDLDLILGFYEMARTYQKTVFHKQWQDFDVDMLQQEILEGRQFKLIKDGNVAAIFAITYADELIWGADAAPSIYIHRIVTHAQFKGQHLVKDIAQWAVKFAAEKAIPYVRMDTWSDNLRLLEYYQNCGFTHTGRVDLKKTAGLPKHYEGISLNLFEIKVV